MWAQEKSKSNQRMCQTTFANRSGKFPWYDRLFVKAYSKICTTGKIIDRLDVKRNQILLGWGEAIAFQQKTDSILSKDVIAFFNPKLPITVRTEHSYSEGLLGGLFQRRQRMGGNLFTYKSNVIWHREAVQSNRKRCLMCEMVKKEIQHLLSWGSKVYHDSTWFLYPNSA